MSVKSASETKRPWRPSSQRDNLNFNSAGGMLHTKFVFRVDRKLHSCPWLIQRWRVSHPTGTGLNFIRVGKHILQWCKKQLILSGAIYRSPMSDISSWAAERPTMEGGEQNFFRLLCTNEPGFMLISLVYVAGNIPSRWGFEWHFAYRRRAVAFYPTVYSQ